jgi:hypothetical protein
MSNDLTRYDDEWARMAQQYASGESGGGGEFLSTKGGVLTFEGDQLPGNQMAVIILDAVQERTLYTTKYDATAETNLPPICYAFGRSDEDMAPHPSMQAGLHYFQPQSEECATCPHNEWGTADTGRGKACSQRRRLALLPAGYYVPRKGSRDFDLHLYTDADHYAHADIAYLKLPVTSVKDWGRYVTQLAASHRRPPLAAISRVYLEPDAKTTFRAKFDLIDLLPVELYDIIMKRHEEAKAGIIFGYPPPERGAVPGPVRR